MIIDIGSRKIKITSEIMRTIYKHRQLGPRDWEAGGMLIGSVIKNSNDIVIEDVTLPIEEDIRSRVKYIRSRKHNILLEQKWIESQYTKMYFGEWHTHPQDIPFPSSQDIKNWINLLNKSRTETDILVFLIAGNTSFKLWIGNRRSRLINQVYEGDYDGFTMDQ